MFSKSVGDSLLLRKEQDAGKWLCPVAAGPGSANGNRGNLPRARILAGLLPAALLAALPLVAQSVPGSPGDLVLGFQASGGTGATTNLEVDLGTVADYAATSLSAGTYNIANLNTDLSSTYGTWTSDSALSFSIVGSNNFGGGNNAGFPHRSIWAMAYSYPATAYVDIPSTGNSSANGQITPLYTAFGTGTALADINGLMVTLGGNTATLHAMTIGVGTAGSFTSQSNANSALGDFNIPNATATQLFESAAIGTLGKATGEIFYFPGSDAVGGNPAADIQGANGKTSYFTLNGNGELTFTVDSSSTGGGSGPSGSRLIDISTRAVVGTGANIEIAGFVITGTEAKTVLIRASGPALAGFGVLGTLPDPMLTLFQGTTAMASNTGWATAGNSAEIASTSAEVGAFAWTAGSADSAILTTLQPGAYTAEVAGASGDTGVALVEVYDCDAPTASSKLVDISTRSTVGTGGNIQIAGIVITGTQAKNVLIRASGPALTGFGVAGALGDPELTLFNGQTVVGSNTGWGTAANASDIAAAAAQVGAFPWSNGSADSAILVALPPGSYTAQVMGASGDQGVALVEVYDVDGP